LPDLLRIRYIGGYRQRAMASLEQALGFHLDARCGYAHQRDGRTLLGHMPR